MKRYIITILILILGLVIGSSLSYISETNETSFSDLGLEMSRNIKISEGRSGYVFELDRVNDIESINKIVGDLQLIELEPKPMEPGSSFVITYYDYQGERIYSIAFDSPSPILYIEDQRFMVLYGGWHKLYAKVADLAFLNVYDETQDQGVETMKGHDFWKRRLARLSIMGNRMLESILGKGVLS